MSRKFITTLLAAAVAVTGFTAAPARADNEDLGAVLAGIATLAIIAKVIDKKHDNAARARETQTRHPRVYTNPNRHPHVHTNPHRHPRVTQRIDTHRVDRNPRHRVAPRPLPDRVARKALPGACFYKARTRNGKMGLFDKRCLNKNYHRAHRLPQSCTANLRGKQQRINPAFSARCLRDHGYTLARR